MAALHVLCELLREAQGHDPDSEALGRGAARVQPCRRAPRRQPRPWGRDADKGGLASRVEVHYVSLEPTHTCVRVVW